MSIRSRTCWAAWISVLRELHGLQLLLQGHPNEELEHVSGAVAALDSAREGAERVHNIVRGFDLTFREQRRKQ